MALTQEQRDAYWAKKSGQQTVAPVTSFSSPQSNWGSFGSINTKKVPPVEEPSFWDNIGGTLSDVGDNVMNRFAGIGSATLAAPIAYGTNQALVPFGGADLYKDGEFGNQMSKSLKAILTGSESPAPFDELREKAGLDGLGWKILSGGADMVVDPTIALGGASSAASKLGKISTSLKGVKGLSTAEKVAESVSAIDKFKKFEKPIKALDTLAVGGLATSGAGDLIQGDPVSAAIKLGFSGLGAAGMKSDSKLSKKLTGYKDFISSKTKKAESPFTSFDKFKDMARQTTISKDELAFTKGDTLTKYAADKKRADEKIQDLVYDRPVAQVADDVNVVATQAVSGTVTAERLKKVTRTMEDLTGETVGDGTSYDDLKDLIDVLHTRERIQRVRNRVDRKSDGARELANAEYVEDLDHSLLEKMDVLQAKYGDEGVQVLKGKAKRITDEFNMDMDEQYLNNILSAEDYRGIQYLDADTDLARFYGRIKEANEAGRPFDWDIEAPEAINPEFAGDRFKWYVAQQKMMDDEYIPGQIFRDKVEANSPIQKLNETSFSERGAYDPLTQLSHRKKRTAIEKDKAVIATKWRNLFEDAPEAVKNIAEPISGKRANMLPTEEVLRVVDNKSGVVKYFKIKDIELMRSLSDIKPQEYDAIAKWFLPLADTAAKAAPGTRQLAKVYTSWNPAFWVKNPVRDLAQSMINSAAELSGIETKGRSLYAKDFIEGSKIIFDHAMGRKTDAAAEGARLAKLGVFTDFYMFKGIDDEATDIGKLIKDLGEGKNVNKKSIKKLNEAIVSVSENSNRYSSFKQAKARGLSDLQATYVAQESSLNFSKHGNHPAAKMIRSLYAFTNPQMLELVRMMKTVKSPEAMSKLMFMVAAPMAGIYEWNSLVKGDNWRDAHTQDELNGYFIIELPGVDRSVRLPKPFGLTMPLSFFESSDAVAKGADPQEQAENIFNIFATNMLPVIGDKVSDGKKMTIGNAMPTLGAPIVQALTNENYWGGVLFPDYIDNVDNSAKMWKKSQLISGPALNSSIGAMLNMIGIDASPEQIKHLIRGYAPGGTTVIDIVSMFEEAKMMELKGETPTTADYVSGAPIAKTFFRKYKPNTAITSEVYDFADRAKEGDATEEEYKTLKARMAGLDAETRKTLTKSLKFSKTKIDAKKKDSKKAGRYTREELLEKLPDLTTKEAALYSPFGK